MITIDKPNAILSSRTIHKNVSLLLPLKNFKNDYWYYQSKTDNYQHFGVNDDSFLLLSYLP